MIYEITYKEKYTAINEIVATVKANSEEEALDLLGKGRGLIEDVDGISDNTEMLEILNIEETE